MTTNQPTCACFLNTLPWVLDPLFWNRCSHDNVNLASLELTFDEKEILEHLAQAWDLFIKLENKHPDDNLEFKDAIHRAQEKIAIRVARRVNPEIWKTY